MKIFFALKNVQINCEHCKCTWTSCSTITISKNQPKLGKRTAKGRRISLQSKYIVENVSAFLEKAKLKGSFIKRLSVVKRTAEATDLSLRTINRIHQEYVSHHGQFPTPVKRYGVSRIRINPNSFDREIIVEPVINFTVKRNILLSVVFWIKLRKSLVSQVADFVYQ